jgi:DNA-binding protein H-NS
MPLESSEKIRHMREQLSALQAKIADEEEKGRAEAIEQIRAIMETYALTPDDLVTQRKRGPNKQAAEPKYQDPASGTTWSGRGREPSWIKGKKRDKFLIAK